MTSNTALVPNRRPHSQRSGFWLAVRHAVWGVAGFVGRQGASAGRTLATAYRAIDPDARVHIAQLPVVAMSMLVPFPKTVSPLADDGCRPLVFVHGFGGRPGNFAGMRAFFNFMQRKRTYLVDFSGARSVNQMTERLQEFIAEVIEVNQLGRHDQIDLVAHSLGGLVARLALREPEVAKRVHTLITLGSPHGGTHLARFADTEVTRDLRPESELMQTLVTPFEPAADGNVRAIALWSRADVFILPAHGAQWPGAVNIEMEGFTHYGYLASPRGWRTVFELLRQN